jgi:hypothetical protein
LKVINDEPVTPDDVVLASETFSILGQLVFSCQSRETILQLYCHLSAIGELALANEETNDVAEGGDGWLGSSSRNAQQPNPPQKTNVSLQEAIGREAMTHHPIPVAKEGALLRRSRALNYMQTILSRYSTTAKKFELLESSEYQLIRRLVSRACKKTQNWQQADFMFFQ